ncbi:MAG TPA: MBL fold metallo-hydrolase [Candidatus Nanopelagicales bacterium]|nr:MBL fold metallo-hydrolase [Candidatus Nanopelagicales bacterium]
MAVNRHYLKQNTLVEPLCNQWIAWPYLVSPHTAAMFTANLHVETMESFISAPEIHASALENPMMMGSRFIHHGPDRVGDIKALLEKTQVEYADLLALAAAIKELDEVLSGEASGYALEPLYPRIPEILKGYVELVYDRNNHPGIRFIEGLLYKSRYYRRSSQSVALSTIDRDARPFLFSTPVLEDGERLHVRVPFDHPGLDELFRMRHTPGSIDHVRDLLGIGAADAATFASLFTEEAPLPRPPYTGDAPRIRYFGHACVLFEARGVSILTDPLISYRYPCELARDTYADLPETIDYVLITHNHQDHCVIETLLQIRHKVRTVIVPRSHGGSLEDPSLKLVLQNIGFRDVREIDDMESVHFDGGSITALPFFGEHGDLDIRCKATYLVSMGGRTALLTADSNSCEPMLYERMGDLVERVDIAFLGMESEGAPLTWAYGPLLTRPMPRKMDQSRRCVGPNYERDMAIVQRFRPGQVYLYAMGLEPWLSFLTTIQYTESSPAMVDARRLVDECRRLGITAERLYGKKELSFDLA